MKQFLAAAFLGLTAALTGGTAEAKVAVWKCEVGPINDKTVFFSGTLLIALDSERGAVWVKDAGISGIDADFVAAKLSTESGVASLRWKMRLAEHLGSRTARFAYRASFEPGGGTITATGWVEGYSHPPERTVSGPCRKV